MSSLELTSGSEFMPPRAGWFSKALAHTPWRALKRLFWSQRFQRALKVPLSTLGMALLVPGWGFSTWWPRLARPALFTSLLLALVFLVFIGTPVANVAFTLLISLHITSFLYALEPHLAYGRLRDRLLTSVAVMIAFWGLIYLPARALIERHLFIPLSYQGKVVVVSPLLNPAAIRRGDLVAFETLKQNREHANVIVRDGINLGPVLALPGSQLSFSPRYWAVNGAPQPGIAGLPTSGDYLLGKAEWFVRPEFVINGRAADGALEATLWSQSIVPRERLKGKALRHWFWRRQY